MKADLDKRLLSKSPAAVHASGIVGALLVLRATSAFGSALLILAVLVLGEHAFRVDLGIDWASLHAWLHDSSRSPGRMSASTASAFLMSGVVLMLATRVRTVGL